MPNPSITPAYVIGLIVTIAGLFATQGWITNSTEKLVAGLAAVIIPAAFVIAHSLFKGRVHAATISTTATHRPRNHPPVHPAPPPVKDENA